MVVSFITVQYELFVVVVSCIYGAITHSGSITVQGLGSDYVTCSGNVSCDGTI